MAKRFGPQIKKLQRAINDHSVDKILINHTQFYIDAYDMPVETIIIKKMINDPNRQRKKYVELFSSSSDVQIVLWLRDYWYQMNGWQIPTDNQQWLDAKRKYQERVSRNEGKRQNNIKKQVFNE